MARKPRIQYEGALYHVMCRGNRDADIFLTSKDRRVFVETLGEVCSQTGWKVYAYVLMSNHYHLLLETPEANLVAGMKWFQGTFTQRFNSLNKMRGHLFQGRYKALIIDPSVDNYFSVVSSYIHLNPARAGLRKSMDYRWSSYPSFIGQVDRPEWLYVDRVFGAYGVTDNAKGRSWYREYMEKRCAEVCNSFAPIEANPEWDCVRKGWFLGDDGFRRDLTENVDREMVGKSRDSFTGDPKRLHDEHAAEQLLSQGLEALGLAREDLKFAKKNDSKKQLLAWLLRSKMVVSRAWVAEKLYMGHCVNVSRATRIIGETTDENLVKSKGILIKCTH